MLDPVLGREEDWGVAIRRSKAGGGLALGVTLLLALVWFANGLLCKVFGLVPRHRDIVARVLGEEVAPWFTPLAGLGEVAIGVWVLLRVFPRVCALLQMGLVLAMNVLEFFLAGDLLLWGRANALFALLFVLLAGYWGFVLMAGRGRVWGANGGGAGS